VSGTDGVCPPLNAGAPAARDPRLLEPAGIIGVPPAPATDDAICAALAPPVDPTVVATPGPVPANPEPVGPNALRPDGATPLADPNAVDVIGADAAKGIAVAPPAAAPNAEAAAAELGTIAPAPALYTPPGAAAPPIIPAVVPPLAAPANACPP